MSDTLKLKPGSRLRTGGATYEVTDSAAIPAGVVEVEPQATRLLKVFCAKCGYTARITQRWIKTGIPECPVDRVTMAVESAKPAKPVKSEAVAAPAVEPIEVVPTEEWIENANSELAKLLAEL